ncbi:MAG: hypothetical protein OXI95_18760 [bacterium]|nr:hypothetical protein [bacterium]
MNTLKTLRRYARSIAGLVAVSAVAAFFVAAWTPSGSDAGATVSIAAPHPSSCHDSDLLAKSYFSTDVEDQMFLLRCEVHAMRLQLIELMRHVGMTPLTPPAPWTLSWQRDQRWQDPPLAGSAVDTWQSQPAPWIAVPFLEAPEAGQ